MAKSQTTDLIAALKGAKKTDLDLIDQEIAAIDERIEQLHNERGALAGAKKLLDLRLNGTPMVGGKKNPKLRAERVNQIYDYLYREGAAPPKQIAEAIGLPIGTMASLLKHEWFKRVAEGHAIAKNRDGTDD